MYYFFSIFNGILKRECAVRPPGKIDAATPDDAVASAIICFDLISARSVLYRNVFPVPVEPSMKNAAGLLRSKVSRINSYACFYSEVK